MSVNDVLGDLAVAGQIAPGDVARIAEAGFRSIICNRPDGEEIGQPGFAEIDREAAKHGIETRYVPVVPAATTEMDVRKMRAALDAMPGPILAYCRSGARSQSIIAASTAIAA